MQRVLIVGADGFLGAQAAAAAWSAGFQVRALVRPGRALEPMPDRTVELASGSLSDPASLASACRGVDVVLQLAGHGAEWGSWSHLFETHVHGTDNLLRAAVDAGCRRLVLLSNLSVHRPTGHRGAREDTPRDHLTDPHAASRIQAELVVEHAHGRGEIEGVIVRPGTLLLGPGDTQDLDALTAYVRLGLVPLVGGGEARTCFSYSENLAEGLVLAARHPDAAGRSFVMEDGVCVSWRHVFGTLARMLGLHRPVFVPVPCRLAGLVARGVERRARARHTGPPPRLTRARVELLCHDSHFVSDRARVLLGYQPRVGFYEALERSVRWYRGR